MQETQRDYEWRYNMTCVFQHYFDELLDIIEILDNECETVDEWLEEYECLLDLFNNMRFTL